MVTCSLDALKTSWRRKGMRIKREKLRCYNKLYIVERRQPSKHLLVFKTSSRRLQHVFSVTVLRLPRRLQDVLEDKKFLRWRRLQDVLKIRLEDVLKTCLEEVFKTSWRQTKCLLVKTKYLSVSNKSKCVSNKSMFHKSISDKSNANPKCAT